MLRKILFFINPISGTSDKSQLVPLIAQKAKETGFAYEIIHTTADGLYPGLTEKIIAGNISDVVACGGDGTVNQIVMATNGIPVNVGIVPLGSGNGLALTAGIPKDPSKAIDLIISGKPEPTDGFMINNRFSCMLCGLGFDAQVAHDFAKQEKRGLLTYTKQTLKNFTTATAYPFKLKIQNREISTKAFFISIANSNQFGNNFTIAPKASLADGLIDVVVVKKMNKLRLLLQVGRQIFAGKVGAIANEKKIRKDKVLYFQTTELEIENPAGAPLHIDGDPAETAHRFVIKVVPAAFNLIKAN